MTAAAPAGRRLRFSCALLLALLILLCLLWELWLAPLRPGGSWLALKALPLLWIAPGIARGRRYTYRASTMLILAYLAEGLVRAYSDTSPSAMLAAGEIALALLFFFCAIAYVRATRGIRSTAAA